MWSHGWKPEMKPSSSLQNQNKKIYIQKPKNYFEYLEKWFGWRFCVRTLSGDQCDFKWLKERERRGRERQRGQQSWAHWEQVFRNGLTQHFSAGLSGGTYFSFSVSPFLPLLMTTLFSRPLYCVFPTWLPSNPKGLYFKLGEWQVHFSHSSI